MAHNPRSSAPETDASPVRSEARARTTPWWSQFSLRRVISSNRFIPEVDGFRFVAIGIVIMSHIYGQLGSHVVGHQGELPATGPVAQAFLHAFLLGPRGVYLFFTISGFILAMPFARHHLTGGSVVRLRSYFWRRVTRLEPPYVLIMVLRAGLFCLTAGVAGGFIVRHLLASLFYMHWLIFGTAPIINYPAWSLEVEIQFYLLTPLLTSIFAVRDKMLRRTILVALIAASGVLATLYVPPIGRLSLSLANFLQFFLAGFLLVDLYLLGDKPPLPRWLWDVIAVVAVVWILYSRATWFMAILPFVTIALYMAGFHGGLTRAFFAWRPISLIGGMCYSIYLTHTLVLSGLGPMVRRVNASALSPVLQSLVTVGLSLVLVMVVGTVYFVLIERPCMDPLWPGKLWSRLTGRVAE